MVTRELARSEFEVLNVIALKKMCSVAAVAQVLEVAEGDVADTVAALERDELIGRVEKLLLPTDDAGLVLEAFAAWAYGALRSDPATERLHERFERINAQFLQAMSAWQQIEVGDQKVANDHSDPDYDERIISRAGKLVERLAPITRALADRDPRFDRYRTRFDEALTRVDRGEVDYLTSPRLESVHNIWFEFHEDLLRTLGRERKE
jgi:hypothetical protein